MKYNQNASNNNIQYNITEYKTSPYTCDGRGCHNIATHCLKISFVKQLCWFCSSCKQSLEEDNLIDSSFAIHRGLEKEGL
jgi:hypothetical protein